MPLHRQQKLQQDGMGVVFVFLSRHLMSTICFYISYHRELACSCLPSSLPVLFDPVYSVMLFNCLQQHYTSIGLVVIAIGYLVGFHLVLSSGVVERCSGLRCRDNCGSRIS